MFLVVRLCFDFVQRLGFKWRARGVNASTTRAPLQCRTVLLLLGQELVVCPGPGRGTPKVLGPEWMNAVPVHE